MRRAITSGERTGLYSGVFLCRRPPGVDGSASEEDDRDLSSPEATDSPDREPPELSCCAAKTGGWVRPLPPAGADGTYSKMKSDANTAFFFLADFLAGFFMGDGEGDEG